MSGSVLQGIIHRSELPNAVSPADPFSTTLIGWAGRLQIASCNFIEYVFPQAPRHIVRAVHVDEFVRPHVHTCLEMPSLSRP